MFWPVNFKKQCVYFPYTVIDLKTAFPESKNEDLVAILTTALLKNEFSRGKSAFGSAEELVAGGVARSAVARLLRPPEFRKKTNEFAVRYRIMFTGPRNPENEPQ